LRKISQKECKLVSHARAQQRPCFARVVLGSARSKREAARDYGLRARAVAPSASRRGKKNR
jgi:hypothetical protein